jgi:ureidoglycolate lyase
MTTQHEIRAHPLTAEAFAPFGHLIAPRTGAPDYRGASGTEGWHMPFEAGRPLLSLLRTPFAGLRFTKMERHVHVTQAFVPLGGSSAVVAVAPPSDVLRIENIRAFLLDGSAGYVMRRGTWHSLDRFPLAPPHSDFLMITDHETQDDLTESYAGRGSWALTQEVDLGARYGTTIAIVA